MTLLEATGRLIEFAKQKGKPTDKVLKRAVKRMEDRHYLLRYRAIKAKKRNRDNAFWDAMGVFNGAAHGEPRRAGIACHRCSYVIYFGEFLKYSSINGRGQCLFLDCPVCGFTHERAVGIIQHYDPK